MSDIQSRLEAMRSRGVPKPLLEQAKKVCAYWRDNAEQRQELIDQLKALSVEDQREIYKMFARYPKHEVL